METGNSVVLARVTWDQEPEDSRQHISREESSLWSVWGGCGGGGWGVPFQKYTGSSLSLYKKAKMEKKTPTPMRFRSNVWGVN